MNILAKIQKELKAPKNQLNKFGGYKYRSCEDILEAIKPLLGDAHLTITDEVVQIGDRFYVQATASLVDGEFEVATQAYAREAESKKGMDEAQITGAASSYARKYALNGLFCIDDTKDADTTNRHEEVAPPNPKDIKGVPDKNDFQKECLTKKGQTTMQIVEEAYKQFITKHQEKLADSDGLADFSIDAFIKSIETEFGKLPTNKASIPKILEQIKPEDVIVRL